MLESPELIHWQYPIPEKGSDFRFTYIDNNPVDQVLVPEEPDSDKTGYTYCSKKNEKAGIKQGYLPGNRFHQVLKLWNRLTRPS